jgi:aldose 1-epimerase
MRLRMYTNAPGMQLYTGNSLDGRQPVPGVFDAAAAGAGQAAAGGGYPQYGGLCLEVQAFPNAINTPGFPSMVLRPGQTFSNHVKYEFDCESPGA